MRTGTAGWKTWVPLRRKCVFLVSTLHRSILSDAGFVYAVLGEPRPSNIKNRYFYPGVNANVSPVQDKKDWSVSWLLAFCPHSSAQPVTSNLSVWELKWKRGSSDFSPIASPHSCIGMKLLIELISAVHSLSHTLLMIYDAQTGRPPSLIQNKPPGIPGISLRESWGDYKTGSLCAARTGRSFRNIHTLVDKSLL